MDQNWLTTRITSTFGIELSEARVSDGIDPAWLVELLEEHLVVVFREQFISPSEQVALGQMFGELTPAHPVIPGHPDHPEILIVDGAAGGRNARWHTDVTFVPTPPAISVLVADVVPVTGGDTMWADRRTAYERLNPALRQALDGLEAVHRISPLAYWGEPFDTALGRDDAQQLLDDSTRVPAVSHPVVRVHPTTGRPNLFVNPGFTTHIVGMSRIESDGLLQLLYHHMEQPELVLRHRWRAGDIAIWDNRATAHYAVDDYGTSERLLRRVTVRGGTALGPTGLESRIVNDPLIAIR